MSAMNGDTWLEVSVDRRFWIGNSDKVECWYRSGIQILTESLLHPPTVQVKFGSSYHEISVSSQPSIGELKGVIGPISREKRYLEMRNNAKISVSALESVISSTSSVVARRCPASDPLGLEDGTTLFDHRSAKIRKTPLEFHLYRNIGNGIRITSNWRQGFCVLPCFYDQNIGIS